MTLELSPLLERYAERSPLPVLVRGLLERCLNPQQLDAWFERVAEAQYTRQLLFSTLFDLMGQVVLREQPSVLAAYRAGVDDIGVSVTSVYNKLNGLETGTSAGLVDYSGAQAGALIEALGGTPPPWLPGRRVKILDGAADRGNTLGGREHRLQETRASSAAPLPGQALAVLDARHGLITALYPCEDAYTQERALAMRAVLPDVVPGEVWVADRNFCTRGFLEGLAERGAEALIREHDQLRFTPHEPMRACGRIETGRVAEQGGHLGAEDARDGLRVRRIAVYLDTPTRDGEEVVYLISTVPPEVADAATLATLYRARWTVGVSGQRPVIQSVKVRPRQIDSSLVAGEVPWRESKTVKPSDKVHRGCIATHQVVTCSERRRSLVTRNPVAEPVHNVRKQQGLTEMSPTRRSSPAGYQRRHDAKDYRSTGETLGTRRRKPVEEPIPITVSGKGGGWYQGGGSGRSTADRRAAKRAGREGPGPVGILFGQGEVGVR